MNVEGYRLLSMLHRYPIFPRQISIADNQVARGIVVFWQANLQAVIAKLYYRLRVVPLEFRHLFSRDNFTHSGGKVKGFGFYNKGGNRGRLIRGLGNWFLFHTEIIA